MLIENIVRISFKIHIFMSIFPTSCPFSTRPLISPDAKIKCEWIGVGNTQRILEAKHWGININTKVHNMLTKRDILATLANSTNNTIISRFSRSARFRVYISSKLRLYCFYFIAIRMSGLKQSDWEYSILFLLCCNNIKKKDICFRFFSIFVTKKFSVTTKNSS